MLSTLFGVRPASVRPMTFVGDQCKAVRSRCDQCLEQHQCRTSGIGLHDSSLRRMTSLCRYSFVFFSFYICFYVLYTVYCHYDEKNKLYHYVITAASSNYYCCFAAALYISCFVNRACCLVINRTAASGATENAGVKNAARA